MSMSSGDMQRLGDLEAKLNARIENLETRLNALVIRWAQAEEARLDRAKGKAA